MGTDKMLDIIVSGCCKHAYNTITTLATDMPFNLMLLIDKICLGYGIGYGSLIRFSWTVHVENGVF